MPGDCCFDYGIPKDRQRNLTYPMAKSQKSIFSIKLEKYFGIVWKGWSTVLIWTFGIVLMTSMTIKGFLPLLSDYKYENVATKIAVIKNGSVEKPNISVCLPFPTGALSNVVDWLSSNLEGSSQNDSCSECDDMRQRAWDVWRDLDFRKFGDHDKKVIRDSIAKNIVMKLFHSDDGMRALDLSLSNFNWNGPILDAVKLFFCSLLRMDSVVLLLGNEIENYATCGFDTTNLTWKSNRDLEKLFEQAVKSADMYLNISMYRTKFGELSNQPRLLEFPAMMVYGNEFCFPIPPNYDHMTFLFTPFPEKIEPPWRKTERNEYFSIVAEDATVYLDEADLDLLYRTDPANLKSINSEMVILSHGVNTRVVEKRNQPCSKSDTPAICLIKRQIRETFLNCKCIPFSFRHHLHENRKNFPYCDGKKYQKCKGILRKTFMEHRAECNKRCELTFYKWKQENFVKQEYEKDARSMHFDITLTALYSPFLEFTVVVKDTPEKFLCQVGGLLNLYLGCSGLSLCAFVIFVIDSIKRWKGGNLEEDKNGARPDSRKKKTESDEPMIPKIVSENGAGNEELERRFDELALKVAIMEKNFEETKHLMETMQEKLNENGQTLENVEKFLQSFV